MSRQIHVRDYTRNKPERPLAFYQMLDKLEREVNAGKPSPEDRWRDEFHAALFGGISREELEQIAGRR